LLNFLLLRSLQTGYSSFIRLSYNALDITDLQSHCQCCNANRVFTEQQMNLRSHAKVVTVTENPFSVRSITRLVLSLFSFVTHIEIYNPENVKSDNYSTSTVI